MREWKWVLVVLFVAYIVCVYAWLFGYNPLVLVLWLLLPTAAFHLTKNSQRQLPEKLGYLVAVPIIWTVCSVLSYYNPGDEYYLYVIGSHPGLWITFFNGININNAAISLLIAGAGLPIIVLLGWLATRLHMDVSRCLVVFAVSFLVVLTTLLIMVAREGSVAGKHGSYLAYVFAAFNFALTWSMALAIALTSVIKLKNTKPRMAYR